MTLEDFLKWANTPLGSAIVGGIVAGLVLAVVLAVVSRIRQISFVDGLIGVLEKIFLAVEWCWMRRLVVTTKHRYENSIRSAVMEVRRGVTIAHEAVQPDGAVPIEMKLLVPARAGPELRSSAPAAVQTHAPATLPLPKPRWSIYFDPEGHDNGEYFLRNAVPRSVAREVRLDPHVDRFQILDAGHFEDMSGAKLASFQGQYFGAAASHGVPFTVAWYDENGEQQRDSIELPPWRKSEFY